MSLGVLRIISWTSQEAEVSGRTWVNTASPSLSADVERLFQAKFPGVLAHQTYRRIQVKMDQHFTLTGRRLNNPGQPSGSSFQNTAAVLGSVMEDSELSTIEVAQQHWTDTLYHVV